MYRATLTAMPATWIMDDHCRVDPSLSKFCSAHVLEGTMIKHDFMLVSERLSVLRTRKRTHAHFVQRFFSVAFCALPSHSLCPYLPPFPGQSSGLQVYRPSSCMFRAGMFSKLEEV